MPDVVPYIREINQAHVALPGPAVVEVAAADDETAFTIQKLPSAQCAVASADRTTREPGEPGVRSWAAKWPPRRAWTRRVDVVCCSHACTSGVLVRGSVTPLRAMTGQCTAEASLGGTGRAPRGHCG